MKAHTDYRISSYVMSGTASMVLLTAIPCAAISISLNSFGAAGVL